MDKFTADELIAEIDKIYPIIDKLDDIISGDQVIFEKGSWLFYNRRIDCLRDGVSNLKSLFKADGVRDE